MRMLKVSSLLPLGGLIAAILSTGCSIASDYRIPSGSTHGRSYTSISGDIEVGQQASIRNAKTISGDIEIREGSRVRNLTTVAGNIRLAPNVGLQGSIRTVAGDIEIAAGCTISGNITTVAGDITLTDSLVEGDVTLAAANLDVTRTRIAGTVRIKRSNGDEPEVAELTIGPGSELGSIVVEDRARARLRIHRSARIGSIAGVDAEYYD